MSFVGYNGFGGRFGTTSSYIKQYSTSINQNIAYWIYLQNTNVNNIKTISPLSTNQNIDKTNVYINGDLTVTGTIINPSDIKLKKNIKDIESNDLNNLLNLEPKKYNLKDDENKIHYGLIAQDVEKILPSLVNEIEQIYDVENDEIKYKGVNYLELIPLMLKKIKEMQIEINNLNKKICIMEEKNE